MIYDFVYAEMTQSFYLSNVSCDVYTNERRGLRINITYLHQSKINLIIIFNIV